MRNNRELIILPTGKHLGPAAMDVDDYMTQVFEEHLLTKTYAIINQDEADTILDIASLNMWNLLEEMTDGNSLGEQGLTFIKRSFTLKVTGKFRMAQFYGAPKVHKEPMKLRPVVCKCGTELEILS